MERTQMKTLRQIYDDLIAAHAAGAAGEIVTTFSDKGRMHSYIEYYERWFEPRRLDPVQLLEIGVMTGGSMLLWQHYFDDVLLAGIDLRQGFNQTLPFQDEILCMWRWGVDSTDPAQVPALGQYDFVIDDGAHDGLSQCLTFQNYWPHVTDGGTYFIEDIESDTSLKNIRLFLQGLLKDQPHTIDYYRGLAHRQDDRILAITKEPK
jgi:hypothetical protein